MAGPLPPRCAARLEARSLIATGGYGAVWLARHRDLDRDAVVKLFAAPAGESTEVAIARSRDEARITASLAHPQIVVVHEYDVEGGAPWIAYEYLPGSTLAATLERGRMPLDAALDAARQIASALAEVQPRGVLHRDVEPENVIEAEPGRFEGISLRS